MKKQQLGLVGWRGMVGSVLLERMVAEGDLLSFKTTFFSSSLAGSPIARAKAKIPVEISSTVTAIIKNSYDVTTLLSMDIILSTQGGTYSAEILPKLRSLGWKGYWLDAASTYRLKGNCQIVLDPLNRAELIRGIKEGIKTFAGANCSTATLLMGLAGLFKAGLIEWLSFMSYQSISGAGARALQEFVAQNTELFKKTSELPPTSNALHLAQTLNSELLRPHTHTTVLGAPLATNILPWIDTDLATGYSREEQKTMLETNKILATALTDPDLEQLANFTPKQAAIMIDGTCVRVGVLRAHSFGCTFRLRQDVDLAEVTKLLTAAHEWLELVPNTREATLGGLAPVHGVNSLKVLVGRLRRSRVMTQTFNAFIITDQLLWGAAEPLRRMLVLLKETLATLPELPRTPSSTGAIIK